MKWCLLDTITYVKVSDGYFELESSGHNATLTQNDFLENLHKIGCFQQNILFPIIKDEVLLTVGCPIFPFYIDSQISVHRKFKKIDQLIFRNAKEIYFNEKFPIL